MYIYYKITFFKKKNKKLWPPSSFISNIGLRRLLKLMSHEIFRRLGKLVQLRFRFMQRCFSLDNNLRIISRLATIICSFSNMANTRLANMMKIVFSKMNMRGSLPKV